MSLLIILILIIASLLPATIWLLFFLREDVHPEPKKLIWYVFGIGTLTTIPTLFMQMVYKNAITEQYVLPLFLCLAFFEEFFKFLAAYYAVRKSRDFDEPMDAMIYMIAAATGFATIENLLIGIGSLESLTLNSLYTTGNILLLRFIGATLLHILASAIVGYYWAKGLVFKKYGYIIQGIVIATIVHTVFNYLIAVFEEQNLIYSSIILVVAAFFVLSDFEVIKKEEEEGVSLATAK